MISVVVSEYDILLDVGVKVVRIGLDFGMNGCRAFVVWCKSMGSYCIMGCCVVDGLAS